MNECDIESLNASISYDLCIAFPLNIRDGEAAINRAQCQFILNGICRAKVGQSLRELNSYHRRFHPVYKLPALPESMHLCEFSVLCEQMTINVLQYLRAECVVETYHDPSDAAMSCHLLKARLTEEGARSIAAYLHYPLQASRESSPHEEYKRDENYYPPYLPFDSNLEQGGKLIWARYAHAPVHGIGTVTSCNLAKSGVWKHDDKTAEIGSLFRDVDRIRLLYMGLYEFLNLEVMRDQFKLILTWYCLKDYNLEAFTALEDKEHGFTLESAAFNKSRTYLGEELALFCHWLSYLGKILVAPAVIMTMLHLVHFLMPMSTAEWHNHDIPILGLTYAIFIIIWTNLSITCYVREERLAALRWGQDEVIAIDSADDCPYTKPYFYASDAIKPNHFVRKTDEGGQKLRLLVSGGLMALLLILTCGSFVAIFHHLVDEAADRAPLDPNKVIVLTESNRTHHGHVLKLQQILRQRVPWLWLVELAAIYITVFAKLSTYVFEHVFLNPMIRYENHSALVDMKRSADIKIFIYKIFVNISSIVCIWRMTMLHRDIHANHRALHRLDHNIEIQILCFHCFDIVWRYIGIFKELMIARSELGQISGGEQELLYTARGQLHLPDYMRLTSNLSLEKHVEFANVAMFSIACPSLPLISLLSTLADIKLNASRLKWCKRPYPFGASGSLGIAYTSGGHRNDLLRSVGFLAVMTNVSFCMLSTPTTSLSLTWKLVAVLSLLILGLWLKDFIDYKLPALSSRYQLLKSQMELHKVFRSAK